MKRKATLHLYFFCLLMGPVGVVCANHSTPSSQKNLSEKTIERDNKRPFFSVLKTAIKETNPKLSLQLGGFIGSQGTPQLIEIHGTRGDYFSISNQNNGSGLVGLGYYLDAKETTYVRFSYGINAFYLAQTKVKGTVTQEQQFTNLSYQYFITNWPIYFAAKAMAPNKHHHGDHITFDVGIGPNIVHTSHFNEQALLGTVIPDSVFTGQTSTTLTAMAGIGYRINHVLGSAPLECGYRFFYLGQTNLRTINTQIMNHFKTGQSYANALLCTLSI